MQSMKAGHSSYFVTTYIKTHTTESTKERKRKEREKRKKRKEGIRLTKRK